MTLPRNYAAFVVVLSLLCVSCESCSVGASRERPTLTVLVAMSLKTTLSRLAAQYENETGTLVHLQFGGSNTLAGQIEAARTQDVFVSANTGWMQHLKEVGAIDADSIHPFASNRLVAVARKDSGISVSSLEALAENAELRVAIGDPRGVPVGLYAKRALASSGTWERVVDRLVPGSNVRVVIGLAEAQRDVVGLVYRSDVIRGRNIKVLFEIPLAQTGPIIALIGAVTRGNVPPSIQTRAFISHCLSGKSFSVLSEEGFSPP